MCHWLYHCVKQNEQCVQDKRHDDGSVRLLFCKKSEENKRTNKSTVYQKV